MSCSWFIFVAIIVLFVQVNGAFYSRKKKENKQLCNGMECTPILVQVYQNGEWSNGQSLTISPEECATSKTLGEIICPKIGFEDTCSLFSSYGTNVASCNDVKIDENVFVVPAGRLFILPTHGIGHRVEIGHISTNGKAVVIETISEFPRVFKVTNFFTEEEADELIASAVAIDDDLHKLKRSSTGTNGYSVDDRRTSENAFDTKSEVAMRIKKRTFELLGIFPYDETFADGIQVLRYNTTTGYATHMDWIEPSRTADHNYDSAGEGTNRFATLLLYLSDTEEGGETVFPYVAKPITPMCNADGTNPLHSLDSTIKHSTTRKRGNSIAELEREFNSHQVDDDTWDYLREWNLTETETFRPGSWQSETVHMCKNRLAIKPRKTEAILFYSQGADGRPDYLSTHGACPVISGTKWAANLWVWNGPRSGYWQKNEETGKYEKPSTNGVSASFESKDVVGARLYWEDTLWEELRPGQPIKVNTFGGHKWNVKMDQILVATWKIDGKKPTQRFVLNSEDLPVYRY